MASRRSGSRGATVAQKASQSVGRLVVVNGSEAGARFTVGERVVLGRGVEADVIVDDQGASRRHAQVSRAMGDSFLLRDLGSTNGTFVNGEQVERRVLDSGDRIRIGETMLLFTSRDKIEEAIQQRQRLEALGRLTAGISHDFNNMLGAVSANIDYLTETPEGELDESEVRECLAEARGALMRASALTRGLLDFSRESSAGPTPLDLTALLHELAKVIDRTFDRTVSVVAKIDPELAVVGESNDLFQAFLNLCINARDAMPGGGTLTLVGHRDRPREQVVVTVSDEGTGIDEETQRKMFEPFFTTKASGHGSGIGLATVRDLVRAHGGVVEVDSELGRGTTFTIRLPEAKAPARAAAGPGAIPRKASSAPPGGDVTVLLVDDEAVVRTSFSRILLRAGYEVMEAENGRHAIEVYRAAVRKPAVVVLDFDMPVMGGAEALASLRALDPLLGALFVSGHEVDVRFSLLPGTSGARRLAKPCSSSQLLAAVEGALEDVDRDQTTSIVPRPPPIA